MSPSTIFIQRPVLSTVLGLLILLLGLQGLFNLGRQLLMLGRPCCPV